MDLHLKQWRNQHESEQQQHQQHSVKIPKLLLDPHQQASSALPLFVPEPNAKISNLSAAFPDSSTRYPRMGSYFSWAQWQELELQALIYRYMLAGAAVPPELLQPIKKNLPLHSHPYFLHHYPQNYQPALLQSGYWGRAAMDPEPGRCRRTDGKKWRCARDVVAGQKYCERHMHRGRNRSRKPVEMPTPNGTCSTTTANNAAAAFGGAAASDPVGAASLAAVANGPNSGHSGPPSSIDLLHFNQSSSDSQTEHTGFFEAQSKVDNGNDGRILRHFFDDWPRSLQESENGGSNGNSMNSSTCLSISMPGNSSSDVSLKLSTGNGDEQGPQDSGREQPQLNWGAGWTSNQVASMGGPLAEALRSSNSSPTSVLHQLPRSSASETSYVSA